MLFLNIDGKSVFISEARGLLNSATFAVISHWILANGKSVIGKSPHYADEKITWKALKM